MISVADLVKEKKIPGNYFAPDAYIRGDFETGMIENRKGDRLMALPEVLIQAIYAGLDQEIGQASGLVLFNCGRKWGKHFYTRFVEDLNQYYGKPISQMEMVELVQCLKQCWKTHGWGLIDLDVSFYQYGFLVAKITNSLFAKEAPSSKRPACYLEAGILSTFFSQMTGQELHCVQTACESLGAESNYFVLGLANRLTPAEAWLEEGQDHRTILKRLCQNKTSEEE